MFPCRGDHAGRAKDTTMTTILTQSQREDFLAAGGYENCLSGATREQALEGAQFGDRDIVTTHETLADFVATRGRPAVIETPAGTLYAWKNVQMAARKPRGTIFAMFFDGVAVCVFTG